MKKAFITVFALMFFLPIDIQAQDWIQWRGPDRNGISTGSLKLPKKTDGKLTPVWKSEEVLSSKEGGFATPVVADDKVFQYCNWRTYHAFDHRILNKDKIKRLGPAPPENIPKQLLEKVETARISEEQRSLKGKLRGEWVNKWIDSNLNDSQKKDKPLSNFCRHRLNRGKHAVPLEIFEKLKPIIDKKFKNQAELDKWVAESGIDKKDWNRHIKKLIPTRDSTFEDIIFCFNAADGKTLWKKKYPTKTKSVWNSSSTPCIADGKLYVIGANGMIYCLDAKTGEEKWKLPLNSQVLSNGYNSSFAYLDGKVFILANKMIALNAGTGEVVWKNKSVRGYDSSPVIWKNAGKSYLICGQNQLFCLNPADGKVIWKINSPGRHSTPAISGNLMAVEHGKGIVVFKLSVNKAEKIMETDKGSSRGGSSVNDGTYVYSGSREAACIEIKTGKVLWSQKGFDDFSSAILVDGKLLCYGSGKNKGKLIIFEPKTGKELLKAKTEQLVCVCPVLVGNKLYVRTKKDVRCYNLEK